MSVRVLQAFEDTSSDAYAFVRKAAGLENAIRDAVYSYEKKMSENDRKALAERLCAARGAEVRFLHKDPPKIERNEDLPFREILPLGPLARLTARREVLAPHDHHAAGGVEDLTAACEWLSFDSVRVATGEIEDDGDVVSLRSTIFCLKSFLSFYCSAAIGPLPSLGAVDEELVDLCFKRIRQEHLFRGKEVLDHQEQFFRTLSRRPKEKDYATVAGQILHGDPGTGKTYLLSLISRMMRMASITETISVGEMEIGGLKGDICKTLRAVLERPKDFPWLPCFLIIDEIDTLAPDRLRSNQEISESKQGAMGLLITLFKGGRQVPNLYILGTTNRYDSMDEALLRRIGSEFHMGTLTPELREAWLRDSVGALLGQGAYTARQREQFRNLVTAASNGFSGDACSKLVRSFDSGIIPCGGAFEELCAATLRSIISVISRASVPFGHTTAASVLQAALPCADHHNDGSPGAIVEAAVNWLFGDAEDHTGKLIGDIFSGTVEVGTNSAPDESCVEALAFLPSLRDGASNVRASYDLLLSAMLLFCAKRNIARCELVTGGSLALSGFTAASDAKKQLYTIAEMQSKYPSSMLLLDVDSLVAVESQATEKLVGGGGSPPAIQNDLLHACMEIFSKHSSPLHQVMLLCSKKPTACLLSRALEWQPEKAENAGSGAMQPHSRSVLLERKICQNCNAVFSAIDNGPYACRSHTCSVEDEDGVVVRSHAIMQKLRMRCSLFYSCNRSIFSIGGGTHDGCSLSYHRARRPPAGQSQQQQQY